MNSVIKLKIINMKKIYIAGQHVFHKDVHKVSENLKTICKKNNLIGLFPFDNQCDTAEDIYQSNLDLLSSSDFVIAYIEPFRGISIDPGTAMEIGFAKALNKSIFAYRENDTEYKYRVKPCETYPSVEDFGLGENLMIEKSCISIHNSFEKCVKEINKILKKNKIFNKI